MMDFVVLVTAAAVTAVVAAAVALWSTLSLFVLLLRLFFRSCVECRPIQTPKRTLGLKPTIKGRFETDCKMCEMARVQGLGAKQQASAVYMNHLVLLFPNLTIPITVLTQTVTTKNLWSGLFW